jgi:hypothetical protein
MHERQKLLTTGRKMVALPFEAEDQMTSIQPESLNAGRTTLVNRYSFVSMSNRYFHRGAKF